MTSTWACTDNAEVGGSIPPSPTVMCTAVLYVYQRFLVDHPPWRPDRTCPLRPARAVAGTLWSCTKLTGAVQDESGGPTWYSDAGYTAPTFLTNTAAINAASHECADKVPAGGFVHIPAPEPGQ